MPSACFPRFALECLPPLCNRSLQSGMMHLPPDTPSPVIIDTFVNYALNKLRQQTIVRKLEPEKKHNGVSGYKINSIVLYITERINEQRRRHRILPHPFLPLRQ
ncbi:uncharacterized protein LOC123987738 [Osmia bicornis bicornis]|uniref:uncharacterized protein LOC123987738 n=1 Tax=Osmia bicornis bicornis TaxID=1437191 RepID=UPI001EAF2D54|nr:uncharacterized protein LOC123987738 [Osmia bicornis bicornis]